MAGNPAAAGKRAKASAAKANKTENAKANKAEVAKANKAEVAKANKAEVAKANKAEVAKASKAKAAKASKTEVTKAGKATKAAEVVRLAKVATMAEVAPVKTGTPGSKLKADFPVMAAVTPAGQPYRAGEGARVGTRRRARIAATLQQRPASGRKALVFDGQPTALSTAMQQQRRRIQKDTQQHLQEHHRGTQEQEHLQEMNGRKRKAVVEQDFVDTPLMCAGRRSSKRLAGGRVAS